MKAKYYNIDIIKGEVELIPKEYMLPLMIEISQEIYSDIKSALLNPIQDRKIFLYSNNFNTKSEFAIEYFFVDDYNNSKYLRARKFLIK